MIENFSVKISELFSAQKMPKKIAVALSGGADSLALTLLLRDFCDRKKIKLFAVTVDHKMRAASSSEALALSKLCKQKAIFHQILTLKKAQLPKSNVEAQLREMRYEALYEFCLQHEIEFLFLGHQLDDVAENFLIRLFRGSGLDGLAAMQEVSDYKKIKLVRPLLSCSKEELKKFLQQHKIRWFEDETNTDEKFLRNKIRNFLSSFEDKNLLQKRIKNAAEEISQIRDEFDEQMLHESAQILEFRAEGYFLLQLKNFQKCAAKNEKIALKILALALMEISGAIYKPRLEKLRQIFSWIITEENHKAKSFYGCILEKYDATRLVIYRERAAIDEKNLQKFDEKSWIFDGRFLVENKKVTFLNQAELKRIKGLKGVVKKIVATIPQQKTQFFWRTILQTLAGETPAIHMVHGRLARIANQPTREF